MHISAIILSAGASSRMGSDKALLKLPDGTTLLEDQIRRVQAAGISNVRVVLGHNCEKVLKACHRACPPAFWRKESLTTCGEGRRGDLQIPPRPPFSKGGIRGDFGGLLRGVHPERAPASRRTRNDITFIINHNWRAGYFSSIKCGLAGVNNGAILLPLDTVGVPPDVITQIYKKGISSGKNIIPTYDGKGGHPVFLRPELIKNILAALLSSRLDHLLQADMETLKLPVNAKNILNNINTPDEWAKWRSDIF